MVTGTPPRTSGGTTSMEIQSFRTAGLGDTSYLLTHDGLGVLVDPQRDVDRFLAAVEQARVQLRWVLETHLHNDYVSGGRPAAASTGADLVVPAGAVVPFDHVPAFHGEELAERGLTIRPLHTPGHTPEHLSYLVLFDGDPVAVFSGGSLLVGSSGRADLLGAGKARGLALAQYHSVCRLAALPDDVGLYPTHGEGSFCTASGASRHTSTIGEEKRSNPVLAYPDAEAFVAGELDGLLPYPSYYAHMGPANYRGPEPIPERSVPELAVDDLVALADDVTVVDARSRQRAAAGHLPGALTVGLSEQFGVWVGWLAPFGAPLVLVVDDDTDVDEALVQLARIGFDDVRGVFRDLAGWQQAGHPVATFRLEPLDAFAKLAAEPGTQVLDVRDPNEHAAVRLEGATHRYVPDVLRAGVPEALERDKPVLVACGSGYRAAMAASVLREEGFEAVVLDDAGVAEVVEAIRAESA
jgi:hydroxyacylglutathione hydrolase